MVHWALTAAAVLSLLYVIRVLFLSGRQRNAARAKMGFGFSLLATGLWIYVLQDHLGELWPAIRLGFAILFALPAISALANPGGARIMRAILGLMVSVLLAGPVVQDLWIQYGPDGRSKLERQVSGVLEEIDALRRQYESRRTQLKQLEQSALNDVRALSRDWSQVETNPGAIQKLEFLTGVRRELAQIDQTLSRLEERRTELVSSLHAEPTGTRVESIDKNAELELLRQQLEAKAEAQDLGIVERHLRNQELRELFEREQGSD